MSEVAELRRTVADLRRRLLALAAVLPAEYLPLLELPPDDIGLALVPRHTFDGWALGTDLAASDVATELAALWRRLTPTP